MVTLLTTQSGAWLACTTHPIGQWPLGALGSAIRTSSPTTRFLSFVSHFFICINVGIYSFRNRPQKASMMACDCFHFFLEVTWASVMMSGGTFGQARPNRKWLGVSGSRSRGSMLMWVAVRLRWTRLRQWLLGRFRHGRYGLAVLNSGPAYKLGPFSPIRRRSVGLHSIPLLDMASATLFWFQFSTASLISRSPPTKLVPLSLYITAGVPRLDIKRRRAMMKELASIECVISMWTAFVTKHVKTQHHRLTALLFMVIRYGSKKSVPTFVNGGCDTSRQDAGRSAMKGTWRDALSRMHVGHRCVTLLIFRRAFRTQ